MPLSATSVFTDQDTTVDTVSSSQHQAPGTFPQSASHQALPSLGNIFASNLRMVLMNSDHTNTHALEHAFADLSPLLVPTDPSMEDACTDFIPSSSTTHPSDDLSKISSSELKRGRKSSFTHSFYSNEEESSVEAEYPNNLSLTEDSTILEQFYATTDDEKGTGLTSPLLHFQTTRDQTLHLYHHHKSKDIRKDPFNDEVFDV